MSVYGTARKPGALGARLDAGITALRLDLGPPAREALLAYLALLARWGQVYNLTAVRDPWEMIPRHLLDSLSLLPYLGGATVLDVGSGAGLPGIPLAIADPARRYVLLDSNGKKARFLRHALGELGLANASVAQARMESYRCEGKFDNITSRAVASVALHLHDVGHLLGPGGRLLIMKGQRPDAELADLTWRPDHLMVHHLHVPLLAEERHLVEIRLTPTGCGPCRVSD